MRTGDAVREDLDEQCKLWTTAVEDGVETGLTAQFASLKWSLHPNSGCDESRPVWCVSDPAKANAAEIISCDGFESCPK